MKSLASSRYFVLDDEVHWRFVTISGDTSPLHVNAEYARRTPVGQCVVHGAHVVLSALARLPGEGTTVRVARVTAAFRSPVVTGHALEVVWTPDGDVWLGVVTRGSLVVVEVRVTIASTRAAWVVRDAAPGLDRIVATFAVPEALDGLRGTEELVLDCAAAAVEWPRVPSGLVGAVTAVSRIAGIDCPGQQALLRGFEIAPGDQTTDIQWRVVRVRQALRLALVQLSGAVTGGVDVVVRPAPAEQLPATAVRQWVGAAEFASVRCVVVGGSRGLGLLAARLLAAGGAEVVSTSRGGDGEWHPGGSPVRLDVASPSADSARSLAAFAPTHVLHFATPPIPRRLGAPESPELLASYIRVYADGLAWLTGLTGADIFVPSSSFVTERPDGFSEYIAAKECVEDLAQRINTAAPRIMVERLPMLLTDQTTGTTSMTAEGNVAVLLPVLRRFVAREWTT